MPDVSSSHEMMRLFMGFIPARAIYVAAKLGIADLIGGGEKDARSLARELEVDQAALYRILRLLAGLGVVHQDDRGLFSLTPLGETLFQLYTYFMKRGTAAADIAASSPP